MRYQDDYLSLLLAHESLRFGLYPCPCGSGDVASFSCSNCHGAYSHCERCIASIHSRMPLHRIRKWNGTFMEEVELSRLGLVVYFGHDGNPCPIAKTSHSLSTLHIDGYHTLLVAFCACESSQPPHLQLFDNKLFSASIDSPKTVFTFELLRHFRIHHLESKGSAYTYIQSLYRLTNDEGSGELPVCIPATP